MTEAEARDLLRTFDGMGGLEAWIADQPWQPAPGGWMVSAELQGWRFWVALVPGGVQISSRAPSGGAPAVWIVPAARSQCSDVGTPARTQCPRAPRRRRAYFLGSETPLGYTNPLKE
jgi:hypothetical protein